ncbi:MAG TPA: hypothetical protein VF172_00905 [Nitrososphaera sp.]|jgi:hypothetical protein
MVRLLSLLVALVVAITITAAALQTNPAYGHFFGATKDVDGYQVVFAPYPATPVAGSNSTVLNFSVLQNDANIYNIHSALVITDKQTGEAISQVPYRFYEISDISIPYTFNETGDYIVTLRTIIVGDEKYQATPLEASFDISISGQYLPFDELMLFYVTPAAVAIAGIAVYLHSKKKL